MRAIRFIVGCVALAGAAAGCASQPDAVSATPPTVSYRVNGSDVSSANTQAADYCQRYNMAPQLQGVRNDGGENLAHYTCVAGAGTTAYPSSAYLYGAAVPPAGVKCADWWHQSRPGGTNYKGPPVPGCPQR